MASQADLSEEDNDDEIFHFSFEASGGPKTHLYRVEDLTFVWKGDNSSDTNFSRLRDSIHRTLLTACRNVALAKAIEGTPSVFEFVGQRERTVKGVVCRARWQVPATPADMTMHVKSGSQKYEGYGVVTPLNILSTIRKIVDNNKTWLSKRNKRLRDEAVRAGRDLSTVVTAHTVIPLFVKVSQPP